LHFAIPSRKTSGYMVMKLRVYIGQPVSDDYTLSCVRIVTSGLDDSEIREISVSAEEWT